MRKTGIIIVMTLTMLLFAPVSHADPFLMCDPQYGVTHYRVECPDAGYDVISDAGTDTAMDHDLATFPTGEHQCNAYAGEAWTLNGEASGVILWSDPTPFLLGRPAESNAPSGMGIVLP